VHTVLLVPRGRFWPFEDDPTSPAGSSVGTDSPTIATKWSSRRTVARSGSWMTSRRFAS
jgi:hypothetical protein